MQTAALVGSVLLLIGTVTGALVTWVGKRAENANVRFNSLTDQVQEERDNLLVQRDRLQDQLAERDARIRELLQERLTDQVEMARLQRRIIELGGDTTT